jgi:hypothetical protein
LEIVEEWNRFFDMYGYQFPEFEKEWMKGLGKPPRQYNSTKSNSSSDTSVQSDFENPIKGLKSGLNKSYKSSF